MPRFTVNGIELDIPSGQLVPNLVAALESGRYEHTEAAALDRHLRTDDRFLDLGAGAGYLCARAARTLPGSAVLGVEANPEMVEVARATLARAGAAGAAIMHGAVVADDWAGTEVPFRLRQGFWASAAAPDARSGETPRQVIAVPALRLGSVLARHRPSVIVLDIEGGEATLFDRPLPGHARLVILELHAKHYGPAGIKRVFDGLSAAGFAYCPAGSRGATVVFERPPD